MVKGTPSSFWANVDKSSGPDSCWPWTKSSGRGGYGKTTYQAKTWPTHRLAWVLHNERLIPDRKQVNHSCDNRICCNPLHLKLGTQADNIGEAVTRRRMASGTRQGLHTHPESRPRGERNGSAKLNADQVKEIRSSLGPAHLIAPVYGVSVSAIQFIKRRKTWRHI